MLNPTGMALATLTVMLWILWSDTLRSRKPAPILYAMRIALFLIASGTLIVNMVRFPNLFNGGTRGIAITAVCIGIVGAVYFGRRLVRRV